MSSQSALHLTLQSPSRLPLVMGILNLTPDSFSDGGRFNTIETALRHARAMLVGGADLIDIGGESTRPGSDDPDLLPLVAAAKVPVILMHMQGTPATMQVNPVYADVVGEVKQFLFDRAGYAQSIGIHRADILLDPGIGFGKTAQHNLQLLHHLGKLTGMDHPLVVGTSRKAFIGSVTGETGERVFGTAGTIAWAAANGAAIVRVHDVDAMGKVVAIIRAIRCAT
jgi:dihydropteroate synthase